MMTPNSDKMWKVVIKQGGVDEVILNATNRMIDSKTKTWNFFIAQL
jgi:hypothetical protein